MQNINFFTNPENLHQEIDISDISKNILVDSLRKMILIRKAEEKISENVANGIIKCPCHLAIGQEAIGVALALIMRNSDAAFGAHRSHAHYLALNEDTFSLFAEVLGKSDGCSNGMGGSMHIIDNKVGFKGSVPIVGATIPMATGAALSAKLKNDKSLAVSFFGDGACEEGVFHESLNMASVMKLPVIYVCENNLFSSHLHISKRQPSSSTSRFAIAHQIDYKLVDGNDVVSLYKLLLKQSEEVRINFKPFFLEAITYRWKGHVGHRDDIDVGVKRKQDLEIWKMRDPIARLKKAILKNSILEKNEIDDLNKSIISKVDITWDKALKSKYPSKNFLLNPVYSV